MAGVSTPKAENIKAVSKLLNATHFDFEFADLGDGNTGIVSLYDQRYSSSVLQTLTVDQDWFKDGYSCFPEPPYQISYKMPLNHTECAETSSGPSTETIVQVTQLKFVYMPFGPDEACSPHNVMTLTSVL